MWVQDHDETFPVAATWVQDMASTYGVTGKVWDCPTSSFKGTESAPDYFYVAGSFLSNAAMGDVKDSTATPVICDLASPKDNAPYIRKNGTELDLNTDLGALPDARHNSGANLAYADGHVQWQTKDVATSLLTYLPSLIDASDITKPASLGQFFKKQLAMYTGGVNYSGGIYSDEFHQQLAAAGITIAFGTCNTANTSVGFADGSNSGYYSVPNLGSGPQEMPASPTSGPGTCLPPSWWKMGVGGTTFGPSSYIGTCQWGWGTLRPVQYTINGLIDQNGYSTTSTVLTIKPNVTAPTVKRMAIILANYAGWNGYGTASIDSVTIGTTTYAMG
ncbi:MAG TPA: H-X9-DG-CTERM domain-containing protein, partial [Armatimonadota bacterium]